MSPAATPPKDKDTVYLEVDDDITTLVDKVESAKGKIVALVLPKRFATLQSIVNMRLLARSAKTAGKEVVLVTSDSALSPLAGAAGIYVAKNLQTAPAVPSSKAANAAVKVSAVQDENSDEVDEQNAKLDYHRSIGELANPEEEAIALEDEQEEETKDEKAKTKTPKNKKLKVPNFERFRLMLAAGVLAIIGLIVFIILAIFVLPKATITLQTEAIPISANLNLTTSDSAKTLDEAKSVIPASLKTSDFTSNQQVQATGQQNNGDKATGTVVFYNCSKDDTLSGTVRTVGAGTGVTANGLTFITQSAVDVPPSHFNGDTCKKDAPSSSVTVKSQNGGAKYNIDATTFAVSGFSTISGDGSKMTGGTDNVVTILSQGDVEAAKSKVTDQDKTNFSNNFKKQLDDQGLYVLASTLKASDPVVNASPAVGQPASTASISIKITYSVLTVQKGNLKTAVTDGLNKQIDKKKQKIGTDDVLKNLSVNVQSQSSPTVALLAVSEDTTAVPIIDVSVIKKQVGGEKAGDIKAFLGNWPGIKNVDVKMSPFWVSKAPKKPNKVQVILLQIKSSNKP